MRNPGTGRSQLSELLLQRVDDAVERLGRAHHGRGLGVVRPVIAAEVGGLTLGVEKLAIDLLCVVAQVLRNRGEGLGQLRVISLGCKRLGPVQGEPEVGAAVVDFVDLAGRGLAFVEKLLGGLVQRSREGADVLR